MHTKGLLRSVWFGSDHGLSSVLDREFNTEFKWDLNLLDGFDFKLLKNISWKPGPYGFFGLINIGLLELMKKEHHATIIIHGWHYLSNWIIVLFAHKYGHRVALKSETPLIHKSSRIDKKLLRLCIKHVFIKRVDEIHYIGTQNLKFYHSLGLQRKKYFWTPYSVDNNRFSNEYKCLSSETADIREKLGLNKDIFYFVFVGKYIDKKRPIELLTAFEKLPSQVRINCGIIFVGEGELRPKMEQFIGSRKLSNIHLTGFVNQKEIPKYYFAGNVFVMCSGLGETWGLSTNEAMNMGLPIIVSDMTGCAYDLVNGNGYRYKSGDYQGLSGILELMYKKRNKELLLMKQRSREIISDYSFSAIIKNLPSE